MDVLALGTAIGFILLVIRWVVVPDEYYFFLPYNLFLAVIPLGLAWLLVRYSRHKQLSLMFLVTAGFVWLVFFPNAPYIVTDFIHLAPRGSIPIWFDALLILSFASAGLLAGWYSLFLMQGLVRRWFDKTVSWVFVVVCLTLASFGVYLGRFLRWNSWDLFLDPFKLAQDISGRLFSPLPHTRLLVMTGFFLGFFLVSYASFFVFIQRKKGAKRV